VAQISLAWKARLLFVSSRPVRPRRRRPSRSSPSLDRSTVFLELSTLLARGIGFHSAEGPRDRIGPRRRIAEVWPSVCPTGLPFFLSALPILR